MKTETRISIIRYSILGLFGVLVLGLFHTQVLRGVHYRARSENNRIRLIRLEAPRGNIYDRNGILLATSRSAYNVHMIPEDFDPADIPLLEKLLDMDGETIRKQIASRRYSAFTPVLLKSDISKELAIQVEENRPRLSGVFIQVQSVRSYPLGETGGHIVGYIGKISREEYEKRLDRSIYHFNSWIGRSGIERAYDKVLRGEDGGRQLEVNAKGVPIQMLSERKPIPGSDVTLALDARLDAKLRNVLEDRVGAIMVMNLKTGGLISAVSAPGYDPNAFLVSSRSDERMKLIGSKGRPLFDRGFNGLYPAGSVFKLVTAMAALQNKLITAHSSFTCPGYFQFGAGGRKYKCWFHEGHGTVDLYTALERSCNVYFYRVGRLLGIDRLSAYAKKLGFGSSLNMELPTASGLVPDDAWKRRRYKEKWYTGETISLAIGQSFLLVSPIQVLRLVGAIATDGDIMTPQLLKTDAETTRSEGEGLKVKPEIFKVIRQGMLRAVASNKGTAQLARVNFGKLAAKTGTAQAPPGEAHAWFAGFYPFDEPQVAIVVFVERGVAGGITGAQLAKQVVTVWNEFYGF